MIRNIRNIRKIIDFKQIKLLTNSLVLCDIDDTILYYPGFKYNNEANNLDKWINHVKYNKPVKMCNSYFDLHNEVNRTSSKLILLTARNRDFEDLTRDHLGFLGLTYHDIIFCSGQNKGCYLLKLLEFDTTYYNKVVFIDNELDNIKDVSCIYGNAIEYYHFDKVK